MEVSAQLHAVATLFPEIKDWVGLRVGLVVVVKRKLLPLLVFSPALLK
jgi:hypothetical protein